MSDLTHDPEKKRAETLEQILVVLRTIGQTLDAMEDLHQTLERIACSAQEVLGADIVDLYQYIPGRDEFILPPILVGERWHPLAPTTKIYDDDVVVKAVKLGKPQYFQGAQDTPFLTAGFEVPRDDAPDQRFVIREGVISSAIIPLMAAAETVGVMFVNYRTPQIFDSEQRNVIESFANLAAIAIRNARLFQSEDRRRQQAETLQEVARIVNSTLTREGVIDLVLEQLGKVIEYDSASVQLIQGDRRILVSGRGFSVEDSPPQLRQDVSQDPLVSKIVQQRRPLVLSDVKDEPLWSHIPQTAHVKSWIGAPLVAKDQVIGFLTVDHGKAGYYTQESGNIVAAFANQAAVAIYNSAQAQALTELNKLGQRLASIGESSQDISELLEQIAESAYQVLKADLIDLYEYLQERKEYKLPRISVGERRGPPVPKDKVYEDDAVFQLIRRKKPLYVKSVQTYPTFSGDYTVEREARPTKRFIFREGIQSTAVIPLRTGSETVGLMFANYRTPQTFPLEQRELIELLATQAAIALKNARLYQSLQYRVKNLGALNGVGQTLTSGIRLKEGRILKLIHRQASRLMDTKNMYIALYDEPTDIVRFGLAFVGGERIDVEKEKSWQPRRAGKGKTEEIIRTKKPIFHGTKAEAEAWYAQPGHEEYVGVAYGSWLGVPMMVGERVLGVIATYHPTQDCVYCGDDLVTLRAMANQAAIALDNSHMFYDVNRRLEALVNFGQAVTSDIHLSESEIVKLIHKQASKLMDTNNMYIALYDEPTDTIRFGLAFVDGKPVDIATGEGWQPRKAGKGRTEEIIRTKKPIFTATKAEAEAWYAQPGHEDYLGGTIFASWIGVPMLAGEKVLGVIAAYHPTQDYVYNGDDLTILQAMAEQAAIALDNARLYEDTQRLQNEVVASKQVATLGTAMAALRHRINNTFNIIAPNVTRLRKRVDVTDPTIAEILDIIERNARYTSDIIARIQEPLREVEMQEVDVNAVLDDVAGKAKEAWLADATHPAVEVSLDLGDPIPHVQAPIGQIAEVFRNLFDNAYRAMKDGGRLTATSRCSEGTIRVRVQDIGPGIPPAIRDRLFVKPVPSKELGGGAGLGLWLNRLMLQSIGGDVKIENTGPGGTTMLVQISVPGVGGRGR
jgi:GAF domain-containing protein/anti-sigma regulatory factor (Ser/Thr protein kinase)